MLFVTVKISSASYFTAECSFSFTSYYRYLLLTLLIKHKDSYKWHNNGVISLFFWKMVYFFLIEHCHFCETSLWSQFALRVEPIEVTVRSLKVTLKLFSLPKKQHYPDLKQHKAFAKCLLQLKCPRPQITLVDASHPPNRFLCTTRPTLDKTARAASTATHSSTQQ